MGWFGFGSKKKHEEPVEETPIVDDSSSDDDWDDDDSEDESLSVYDAASSGCQTAKTRITRSATPRKNSKQLYKSQNTRNSPSHGLIRQIRLRG